MLIIPAIGHRWVELLACTLCQYHSGSRVYCRIDEVESEILGTFSVGGTAALFGGPGGAVSFGGVFDKQGNVGVAVTGGIGGGTPSVGTGVYLSVTDAPTIYHLAGKSVVFGASINVLGGSLGLDYTAFKDSDGITLYSGWTVTISLEPPFLPADAHTYVADSYVAGFNFWEVIIHSARKLSGG